MSVATETSILPPRYRKPRRIARGGMGEIYHATDETLGRPVAIKVLADRYAEDDSVRERFTREALSAAKLSGEPHTVTIFDVGEWEERPFLVMEYLPGGTLEEVVRKRGAVEPGTALAWLEQAAAALDHAHAHGVVHRDVKPANLLLDREGTAHVADFGIASATGMDSMTKAGTILGTAGYLSPEQASGERATPASDRYALGVVAFELLTGTRPFAADTPTAEATAHVNAPVPSAVERRPDLPPAIDAVFSRALAKDPSARYRSCAELVHALRTTLTDDAGTTKVLPQVAPPAPRPRPRPQRDRPLPLLPLLLAGLLVAALAGIGLAAALSDGDETARGPTTVVSTLVTTEQGQVETREVTVTAEPPPPPPAPQPPAAEPPPSPQPPADESGAALNDRGFALMQQGNYEGALPLLEQAVQKLSGTGELTEAYALYNLAATRSALGNCDGVEDLLARSEAIQGHRPEFDRVRAQCGAEGEGEE